MNNRVFIKGFDKNLKCRGYQFEVGKEYKIDLPDNYKLTANDLCSNKVFHFCDGLSKVHQFYSCLISIQPYWVFLIIAKTMGWNIDKEKTVEVRKNYPKDEEWDKVTKIYCSKDKKSFAKIPKEYQPLMKQYLGKVIGEFVCDRIYEIGYDYFYPCGYEVSMGEISRKELYEKSCLSFNQMDDYLNTELGYGWRISNLVIYDKPRELSEFRKECKGGCDIPYLYSPPCENCNKDKITRPFQSWGYVESEGDTE